MLAWCCCTNSSEKFSLPSWFRFLEIFNGTWLRIVLQKSLCFVQQKVLFTLKQNLNAVFFSLSFFLCCTAHTSLFEPFARLLTKDNNKTNTKYRTENNEKKNRFLCINAQVIQKIAFIILFFCLVFVRDSFDLACTLFVWF